MQGSRRCPLGAIYMADILSRRLLTSSSARFWLEQDPSADEQNPCHFSDSASDILALGIRGQDIGKLGLLTSFSVLVGLGDSVGDCLCCALEFVANFSSLKAVTVLARII